MYLFGVVLRLCGAYPCTTTGSNLKKSVRLLEEDRNRFLLGVAFLLNRDFRDALAQVRRPISDPTLHVKGRYVQALAQGESGLTDQALEQLDAITRLEPGMADAYVSKGALFASEGRIDLATEAWKEGVDNAGQTARLLACEGFALLASGRAQDAVFALTKAARHNPSACWLFLLGFSNAAPHVTPAPPHPCRALLPPLQVTQWRSSFWLLPSPRSETIRVL